MAKLSGMDEFQLFLQFGMGIYCIYLFFRYRGAKEIPQTQVLLSKDIPTTKCKDQAGYLTYILPKLLILGIIMVVMGAAELAYLVNDGSQRLINLIFILIPLGAIIAYILIYRNALKLYFPGLTQDTGRRL